jgi:hypothetical protein
MSEQIHFDEIDFEAIEYRNEYRHTNSALTLLAAQAFLYAPSVVSSYKEGGIWLWLESGCLGLAALGFASLWLRLRGRVVITGQGIVLKRPLLRDVEIAFSEIGEVQVNGMVIRESYDPDPGPVDLLNARCRWPSERGGGLSLMSRDGKRKIVVTQSLENFDRFREDLNARWRSAIGRYVGYARGTSLRQPGRSLKTQETLRSLRGERLAGERPSSEIQ